MRPFADLLQENIKEIHWAFYARKSKDRSASQDPLSSEEEGVEDLSHDLQSLEYILREEGRHVLFDKHKGGVWVFILSHAPDEGNGRELSLYGLESELSVSL